MLHADGAVARGFENAPLQTAWTFRAILEAMARPGRIQPLKADLAPPAPLYPATAAVALTLVDHDTPVWLDEDLRRPDVTAFLKFHCGCPVTEDAGAAAFGFVSDSNKVPPLESFSAGTPDYPDRSATLIVQCTSLGDREDVIMTGPGIETEQGLSIPSLSLEFWHQLKTNNRRYPLGVDVLFTTVAAVAGCPRSVALDIPEAA